MISNFLKNCLYHIDCKKQNDEPIVFIKKDSDLRGSKFYFLLVASDKLPFKTTEALLQGFGTCICLPFVCLRLPQVWQVLTFVKGSDTESEGSTCWMLEE